jgi:hypothetical protein
MKDFFKKYILKIAGILAGGVGGFVYYHFVRCATGTCSITSNPYMTIFYGAFIGFLLFGVFKIKESRTKLMEGLSFHIPMKLIARESKKYLLNHDQKN